MGLLIRRLDFERELARKSAEIQASYAQLEDIHEENVRIQEVLRRYVPPSTWDKIDKHGPEGAAGNRGGGGSRGHVRGHLRFHQRVGTAEASRRSWPC